MLYSCGPLLPGGRLEAEDAVIMQNSVYLAEYVWESLCFYQIHKYFKIQTGYDH